MRKLKQIKFPSLKHFGTLALLVAVFIAEPALASEADIKLPSLNVLFNFWGYQISGIEILKAGVLCSILGIFVGLGAFLRVKALPAHKSLLEVSALIYETCKSYMIQQGKFLIGLEALIGCCIVYYFSVLQGYESSKVALILFWSILGILGSYSVAWFGIRINTYANSRTAFASLMGNPYPVMEIPLRSGMSTGVLS